MIEQNATKLHCAEIRRLPYSCPTISNSSVRDQRCVSSVLPEYEYCRKSHCSRRIFLGLNLFAATLRRSSHSQQASAELQSQQAECKASLGKYLREKSKETDPATLVRSGFEHRFGEFWFACRTRPSSS